MEAYNENKRVLQEQIIPKEFWKWFDLYRRNQITLEEYAVHSEIPIEDIIFYLSVI